MRTIAKIKLFFVIVSIAMLVFGLLWVDLARANGGPHGAFTASTDSCAGCHRSHSATTTGLLTAPEPELCMSCHNGTGAATNVSDGTYLGAGLRGGGFNNALMDVALNNSAAPALVTSAHTMNGSAGVMWGNGAINSGAGPLYGMVCSDCHNPHGESSYRMLRPIPNGSGANTPVTVPDEVVKNYVVSNPANQYVGETYGSLGTSLTAWCSQCHTRAMAGSGSGHTDSGDGIFGFRHNTVAVPCVVCHVSHGTTATMGTYSGAVAWPDGTTVPSGNARSSLLRGNNRAVCISCHVENGRVSGGSCNSCHASPPATGAHLAHSDPSVIGYGMTGSYSDTTHYIFGCGECHPTDSSFHRNGAVDVQLSSSGAPVGSLKERNEVAASYSGGSCSGVYCHSGEQVTSGAVGNPLADAGGNYILDSHGNFTYDPYTVSVTRTYNSSPAWVGGAVSGNCTDCHQFPLTTSFPSVQAGVGDSHQWIDDYGYGNLHAWNMGFDPISCSTCHYGEITASSTWTRLGDVTTYNAVPVADRSTHVNGRADVTFDTINPVVYNTSSGAVTFNLGSATFDVTQKSCASVACHLNQNYVAWGTPYRWYTNECDLCHRYGLPMPPPLAAALDDFSPAESQSVHIPAIPTGSVCANCHTAPHGRQ